MNGQILMRGTSIPNPTSLSRQKIGGWIISAAIIFLIFSVLLALVLGAIPLTLKELFSALLIRPTAERGTLPIRILWQLRLPRICMALIGGFGLAFSGAAMQGILRNPLVSPFTLGISSAAGFGAAATMVMAGSAGVIPFAFGGFPVVGAFLCSLVSMLIVLFLSRLTGGAGRTVILAGVAVMYLFSAGTSILQYTASTEDLARIVFWIMGSLSSSQWASVALAGGLMIAVIPPLYLQSWKYTILSMGDESGISLGVDPKKTTRITIVLCSLLTAGIISHTGVIGFVGLVAPHVARMILGNDYRYLLPLSGLFGAILLVVSDTLSRVLLAPLEFPIGITTAFLGIPFFLYLLIVASRKRYS